MKILVVGGTGLIGAHAVLRLVASGHQVTIGARRAPDGGAAVAGLPVLLGDYAAGDFTERDLQSFDAVVFAAGQDVRHVAPGEADVAFWARYQVDGVPDFVACAKRAGVTRVVQVGSYYHVVMPDLAMRSPYVRARQLADERARELADADFNVSTLNPLRSLDRSPECWIGDTTGWWPGLAEIWCVSSPIQRRRVGPISCRSTPLPRRSRERSVARSPAPRTLSATSISPTGSTSNSSSTSLDSAVRSSNGTKSTRCCLTVAMVAGRGNLVSYEPSERTVELLGYSRDRVRDTLEAVVRQAELYLK